ncbi:hypothetical protein LBMAG33_3880 [Candidatus Levyibacteriota bacterium]|nr:50S ribosomal protein L31 [Candidatus Levybacteria bacterium]GDX62078.1 hypothetical protein LBMAG33_3880 [Candidatus Levybacteria bacterium]
MKANTHPQFFETSVSCACGNEFTIGSTIEKIHIELCNKCHPFYTGEQRFVDTASLIQKYQSKKEKAEVYQAQKIEKTEKKKKDNSPKTLREMLLES